MSNKKHLQDLDKGLTVSVPKAKVQSLFTYILKTRPEVAISVHPLEDYTILSLPSAVFERKRRENPGIPLIKLHELP